MKCTGPFILIVFSYTYEIYAGNDKSEQRTNLIPCSAMDEGRKRVVGIMAAILASLHVQTADDLFGGPQGSPRSDKLIAASVQWAEKIMEKIDSTL